MAYQRVQFIAYCIHTGPARDAPGNPVRYVGISNISEDIKERIKLVSTAIVAARRQANASKSVLKIFMMPEFFFRGPDGAYDMDDVAIIRSRLQDLVKASDYSDWLFVFGTILGSSHPTKEARRGFFKRLFRMRALQVIDPGAQAEIYNISLVQRGGWERRAEAHEYARVVMKRDISNIDFLPAGAVRGLDLGGIDDLAKMPGARQEVQLRGDDGSSIFTYDFGVDIAGHGGAFTFGLEVCLDHSLGRLVNAADLPTIDIQLVPSCGMNLVDNKIVSRVGGFVCNCDGLNPRPNPGYHSDVRKVGPFIMESLAPARELDIKTGGIRINEIFPRGGGKLRIYPASPLG